MDSGLAVQIKNLSFSYNHSHKITPSKNHNPHLIFNQFSFNLKQGYATLLLGNNGCGKSTLINLMGGQIPYSKGSIKIAGKELSSMKASQRSQKVSWLPQKDSGGFEFNVEQFLLSGVTSRLKLFKQPGEHEYQTVREVALRCQIEPLLNRMTSSLSGGEQRLCWIARALIQQAPVMLLDEPASHLDSKNAFKVLNLLAEEINRGRTILFSAHDPNQLFYLAELGIKVEAYGYIDGCFELIKPSQADSELFWKIYQTPLKEYRRQKSRRYFH